MTKQISNCLCAIILIVVLCVVIHSTWQYSPIQLRIELNQLKEQVENLEHKERLNNDQ